MDLSRFDELHVVSDIHMGGKPGFQILRETKRLAGFISWLAARPAATSVGLVLNGDTIDTLAEDIPGYVAVDEAVVTVERIMREFAAIWDALAVFVRTPNRTLVLVLGNHDIELALPPVQRLIVHTLAGNDLAARARIEFSTMGAGFPCMVGNARVYCTHGNEVDPWNYVRYEDLAKAARRVSAGRPLDPAEWEPNAGTKMVKDVMNEVKSRYRWIDLLKPETSAAVGVLVVLDPTQLAKISRLAPIVGERVQGGREFDQRLSAGGIAQTQTLTVASAERFLGANLRDGIGGAGPQSADDMLLRAEKTYRDHLPAQMTPDGTLGTGQLVWDRLTGWLRNVSKVEALRRSVKDWLAEDKTFDVHERDDTCKAIVANVGAQNDFIVTGHTHLERAIDLGAGRYYFNTGTWIRLLRFTDAMLANEKSFQDVYDVLIKGTMESIDEAIFGGQPFVLDQTSSVCIRVEGNSTVGELVHVTGDGTVRNVVANPFRKV